MQTPKEISKLLTSVHALSATQGTRNNLEQQYYHFHKINSGAGKNLRAKYRPPQEV